MRSTEKGLQAYLEARRNGHNVLYRLLQKPEPERGLIHTPHEIVQQPYLWRETASLMKDHAAPVRSFLAEAGAYDAHGRPAFVLSGAGTSDYVGLSLIDLLRRHFRTSCSNWPTTRITSFPDLFLMKGQPYVIIHFARSGNSPESTAVINLALRHYPETVRHIVITCNGEGELARVAADYPEQVYLIVLHEACNDRALAMTSSFSSMVVAGQALVHLDDMDGFAALIERIARAGELMIETHADTIYELAGRPLSRVFFLGNGDLLGAAVESALKIQELTAGQVIAKGEDTLAFRHGPISAVDENTLICFYLSENPYTQRYELDVIEQYYEAFTDLGAQSVLVGAKPDASILSESVTTISYDPDEMWRIPPLYQVNLAILFGQLFGMFAAWQRSLNVDDPAVDKTLYSRTVQGVRIYEYSNGE